jgi:hypothetical protein
MHKPASSILSSHTTTHLLKNEFGVLIVSESVGISLEVRLHLTERFFDWVEVWAIWWEVENEATSFNN